ncbi:unnamed protein product [Ixodes pacificus]
MKAKALQLCHKLELTQSMKKITSAKEDLLDIFFTAKTHKKECPFRAIVTERGTWQGAVSRFLLRQLSTLQLDDPFLVPNSDALIQYLKTNASTVRYGLSLDDEDLFYSIPHAELFEAVNDSVEANGAIAFQNNCGLPVESFLELLRFYLSCTVVTFNGKNYVQRKGICIGSCVAPVLCDIFLSKCDRVIADNLPSGQVIRIFRFVDDYLVLLSNRPEDSNTKAVHDFHATFVKHSQGLRFTHELPTNSVLEFLDLQMTFQDNHLCWMYSPRSKKKLLRFDSAHPKLTKRGIVTNCLRAALNKSCQHSAGESFTIQIQRLQSSGYPESILTDVVENILMHEKIQDRSKEKRSRPAIVPYIHSISHTLKKVANRFDVRVVLSAPDKLKRLCPKINSHHDKQDKCDVKHVNKFVNCLRGVVYEILFSCGKVYVGQTGRCVNIRLREHELSLKSSPAGHLALHVRDCKCTPLFHRTKTLRQFSDQRTRELYEAQVTAAEGDTCISAPSVALSAKELHYLQYFV